MLVSHTASVMRAEADFQGAYDTHFDDLADFETDPESDAEEAPDGAEPADNRD